MKSIRFLPFVVVFLTVPMLTDARARPPVQGAELAAQCQSFAAKGPDYGRTPEGAVDPCRKFLEGYFRILADRNAAEQKLATGSTTTVKAPRPCVRMPDRLTYHDFAGRIAQFSAANPQGMTMSPIDLADATLQAAFPCPDPETGR